MVFSSSFTVSLHLFAVMHKRRRLSKYVGVVTIANVKVSILQYWSQQIWKFDA